QNGLFASAVWDAPTSTYIVKVSNTSDEPQTIDLDFAGLKKNMSIADGTSLTLTGTDLDAENTLDNPDLIKPVEGSAPVSGQAFSATLAPNSFTVYKFPLVKK
ncbi:MAG: alpha-L-arabinofuranosidase, partial [Muribaculaceae bacterium]|nr:alpha-L-arabinofuranosidase [Muribaculaceae bacterium]